MSISLPSGVFAYAPSKHHRRCAKAEIAHETNLKHFARSVRGGSEKQN